MRNNEFIVKFYLLLISPEVSGIISMGLTLAVISEKQIKPLFVRHSITEWRTQAPFAYTGSLIACLLQHFAEGDSFSRNRELPFKRRIFLDFTEVPDISPFRPLIDFPG